MPRVINKIIIHCSDSSFGDAKLIEDWHKERGFKSIGYHYVILNGVRVSGSVYLDHFDGAIEEGRSLDIPGAHCFGENENSIGICLVGKDKFTDRQFEKLRELTLRLMKSYHITLENVIGHYETESGKEQGKTCPNFDMNEFRENLSPLVVSQ